MINYKEGNENKNCKNCTYSRVIGLFADGFEYQCCKEKGQYNKVEKNKVCDDFERYQKDK